MSIEDAEDVTQDMLVRLWGMRNKLDEIQNIEAMAIRSTKNMCLDRLRHEGVKKRKIDVLKNDCTGVVMDRPDDIEMREIIKDVVNDLPEKQRMVMHLRDIEGYEIDEIVEMLGMDDNAVRVNLSRSRKKVKEEVSKIMRYGL